MASVDSYCFSSILSLKIGLTRVVGVAFTQAFPPPQAASSQGSATHCAGLCHGNTYCICVTVSNGEVTFKVTASPVAQAVIDSGTTSAWIELVTVMVVGLDNVQLKSLVDVLSVTLIKISLPVGRLVLFGSPTTSLFLLATVTSKPVALVAVGGEKEALPEARIKVAWVRTCLLYTSPSPRD